MCRSEYEAGTDTCPDCDCLLVDQKPPENLDADADATLVEIYRAAGDEEAFIVQGLLESEGIWCALSSDVPHTVLPLNVDGLGAVRISVADKDAERARSVIETHRQQNGA
jgi:hypothetical protein